MKYQCPNCKNIHEGKVDVCPTCGIRFVYGAEPEKEVQDYQCPKCKSFFSSKVNYCPTCGVRFNYSAKVEEQVEQPVKEEQPVVVAPVQQEEAPVFEEVVGEAPVSEEVVEEAPIKEVVEKPKKKKKGFFGVFFTILLILLIIAVVLFIGLVVFDVLAAFEVIPSGAVESVDAILAKIPVTVGGKPLFTSDGWLYWNVIQPAYNAVIGFLNSILKNF